MIAFPGTRYRKLAMVMTRIDAPVFTVVWVHISAESVDLDSWTDEQLQSVLKWGNARANRLV